jgi:hypothetical protein
MNYLVDDWSFIYPNPSRGSFMCRFILSDTSNVFHEIIDNKSSVVHSSGNYSSPGGVHFIYTVTVIPNGWYKYVGNIQRNDTTIKFERFIFINGLDRIGTPGNAKTDFYGSYTINAVPLDSVVHCAINPNTIAGDSIVAHEVAISASREGYLSQTKTVLLNKNRVNTVNFSLSSN